MTWYMSWQLVEMVEVPAIGMDVLHTDLLMECLQSKVTFLALSELTFTIYELAFKPSTRKSV